MTNRVEPARRVKLLSALLIVGVFAAGIAAGVGLSRWLSAAAPPPAGGDVGMGPLPLGELGLSPTQRQKAHEIGARHKPELEAIRRRIGPEVRAVHEKMEAELRAVLTPEQRARHDRLKADLDRRPPPPDGPPPGPPPPDGPPPPF